MTQASAFPLLVAVLALSGCASSMSGVGGTDSYACKAPEGALCTSVSGVYANSVHGTLPTGKVPMANPTAATRTNYGAASIAPSSSSAVSIPASGSIRSNPRVLRVWIAPWEDGDGDLHEESFVHVVVDTGSWLIDHVRPAGRSRVDGVAPPVSPVAEDPRSKTPVEAPLPIGRLPVSPGAFPAGIEAPTPTER